MSLPIYPEFAPLSIEIRDDLYPALNVLPDGVSEFTFSGLYLFRKTYDYRISHIPDATAIISGLKNGERFFFTPCAVLPEGTLEAAGHQVVEDRDNFDYVYDRKDLAELSGSAYHKKRNLVNAFLNSYSYEQKTLDKHTVGDALRVLDAWREEKGIDGDYNAAKEALGLYEKLGMKGAVYYVDGKPAAYALGEPIAKARMFAVHFEKAIGQYKGIYQFINQAFAQALPAHIRYINREQDLGDEGLRQAKMTYRPSGFVKKYRVYPKK